MVMKFAKDGVQYDASGPLNWARDRGIFIQWPTTTSPMIWSCHF